MDTSKIAAGFTVTILYLRGMKPRCEPLRGRPQELHMRNTRLVNHCPIHPSRIHEYRINTAPLSACLSNSTIGAPHCGQRRSTVTAALSPSKLLVVFDNSISILLSHTLSRRPELRPPTRMLDAIRLLGIRWGIGKVLKRGQAKSLIARNMSKYLQFCRWPFAARRALRPGPFA